MTLCTSLIGLTHGMIVLLVRLHKLQRKNLMSLKQYWKLFAQHLSQIIAQ
jgi:hypothetical protein